MELTVIWPPTFLITEILKSNSLFDHLTESSLKLQFQNKNNVNVVKNHVTVVCILADNINL